MYCQQMCHSVLQTVYKTDLKLSISIVLLENSIKTTSIPRKLTIIHIIKMNFLFTVFTVSAVLFVQSETAPANYEYNNNCNQGYNCPNCMQNSHNANCNDRDQQNQQYCDCSRPPLYQNNNNNNNEYVLV